MLLTFLLQLFILQLVIFGIIIFTLKVILNRQLIAEAVSKLQSLIEKNPGLRRPEILLVTAKNPSKSLLNKIRDLTVKSWGNAPTIQSKIDPSIKGGVVIELGEQRIDYSLRTRLRESGIVK